MLERLNQEFSLLLTVEDLFMCYHCFARETENVHGIFIV